MPSVHDLKPRFQALLRPMVRRLAERGVTANQVTLAALGLSTGWGALLTALHVAQAETGLALAVLPLVLLIRMGLNAVDGMLAREHRQASDAGALLNELGDVLSDSALYLPFTLILGPVWALPVLVFVLTEFCGVLPRTVGRARAHDGPMGKSDRAVVYGLVAVTHVCWPIPAYISTGLAIAIAALALVTCVNRVKRGLHD